MSRVVLHGIVVRYHSRPAEALYERSPILFASFVFLVTIAWIELSILFGFPATFLLTTVPLVILTAAYTPVWFTTRAYIEGDQTMMLDDRGLQVGEVLIPWSDLRFARHGDLESSISLWTVGPETIIASFERDGTRFSAFLGVRFRDKRPFAFTESLTTSLAEKDVLRIERMIVDHETKRAARAA